MCSLGSRVPPSRRRLKKSDCSTEWSMMHPTALTSQKRGRFSKSKQEYNPTSIYNKTPYVLGERSSRRRSKSQQDAGVPHYGVAFRPSRLSNAHCNDAKGGQRT